MAERDVDHATLREMAHVGQVVVECQSVLNAEHYRLAVLPLVLVEVGRCACYADIVAVLVHDLLQLVEYEVGVLGRG